MIEKYIIVQFVCMGIACLHGQYSMPQESKNSTEANDLKFLRSNSRCDSKNAGLLLLRIKTYLVSGGVGS